MALSNQFEALNGVVPAVSGDRARLEATLLALRRPGFGDDEMGLNVSDSAHHLLTDSANETLKGVVTGF